MNRSPLLLCAAIALMGVSACSQNNPDQAAADNAANASAMAAGAANDAAAASSSAAGSAATAANAAATTASAAAAGAAGLAAPTTSPAADFVTKAAATDMYEIAAAKLAVKNSAKASVKAFAQMMIRDHTQSTANLKAAMAASGQSLALPQDLPADLLANLDALKSASKTDFDSTYLSQMVDTHQQAETVIGAYASGGDVAQLKTFASKTLPVVRAHLARAQAMQAKM
ncbi:MAG TPA: DUF4142 domain-containing protein [Caulobacteraceae bacterium]